MAPFDATPPRPTESRIALGGRAGSALAAALLLLAFHAAPADACSRIARPNHTTGPFYAPDGGVWLALPVREDGALDAVHLDADGNLLHEVVLRTEDLTFQGSWLAADADGRLWAVGFPSAEIPPNEGWQLVAFSRDGTELARAPTAEGQLFGFDPAGLLYTYSVEREGLRIARTDLLAGSRSELFAVPHDLLPKDFLSSCSEPWLLTLADDGAVFLLTEPDYFLPDDVYVLRRFTPGGVETDAWQLPGRRGYEIFAGRNGAVLLRGNREDGGGGAGTTVWRVDSAGLSGRWSIDGASHEVVPDAAGGVVMRTRDDELLWFGDDGEPRSRWRFGATPKGMSWGEKRARVEAAMEAAASGAVDAEPDVSQVDAAALGSGAEAERATQILRGLGPAAVDLVVEWTRQAGPGTWYLPPDLLRSLVAADPDAVGGRLAAALPEVPERFRSSLVSVLADSWPRPGAAFVAALEEELLHRDGGFADAAAMAFAGAHGDRFGPVSERFPASPAVVQLLLDRIVAEAAGTAASDVYLDTSSLFHEQFPSAAATLDAVLRDRRHPARPAVLERLAGFALPVPADREPEAAVDLLARYAAAWAASPDADLARAATPLAAALGDAASLARLPDLLATDPERSGPVTAAVERLKAVRPDLLGDDLRAALTAPVFAGRLDRWAGPRLLGAVYGGGSGAGWSAVVRRLAERPAAGAATVAAALLGLPDEEIGAVDEAAYAALVDSGFAARLLGASLPVVDDPSVPFRFAALVWNRLPRHLELRQQLEIAFRAACEANLRTYAESEGRNSWRPPPPCLAAMAGSGVGRRVPDAWLTAMAGSGVGRRVPDAWLTAQLDLYRARDAGSRAQAGSWLPTLAAVARQRGPWPGLAETVREEVLTGRAPVRTLDRSFLDAVGAGDGLLATAEGEIALPRPAQDLPLLDLEAPLPGDG